MSGPDDSCLDCFRYLESPSNEGWSNLIKGFVVSICKATAGTPYTACCRQERLVDSHFRNSVCQDNPRCPRTKVLNFGYFCPSHALLIFRLPQNMGYSKHLLGHTSIVERKVKFLLTCRLTFQYDVGNGPTLS